MIVIENVCKRYGRTVALDGVTLTIRRGEAIGIIGPNGAGKTTLMAALLGLIDPTAGTILIDGGSPHSLATKRRMGYLPERLGFNRWMSGRALVTLHARLCGIHDRSAVETMLERVGLDRAAWDRPLRKYSRGMLQRTALAQALIGSPDFLFLDEPTSGIDPAGAIRFRDIVHDLKRAGVTIVVNSHQLDQMERICDRVAFVRAGKIEAIEDVRAEERLEDLFLKLEGAVA
jgi:ABC-2 type transport system ATP-binding protein